MSPTKVDDITVRTHSQKVVTTTYSLGDKGIVDGLRELLDNQDLTLDGLNEFLHGLGSDSGDCDIIDLEQVARIKVRSGMFSRGIYTNEKESGMGGWKGYPIKGKESAETFIEFYRTSPKFV
jgi:hypothetical protein